MNTEDFKEMAEKADSELSGKAIHHVSWGNWGMAHSLTIHFTDGTYCEVTPENDEGFSFSTPIGTE